MPFLPIDFFWLAKRQEAIERGRAEPFEPEIFDVLRNEWAALSIAYQKLDPGSRLLRADRFPGYLTAVCGQWRVFVPWSLVTSFPGDGLVSDFFEVGMNVAIPPVNSLCLSGSSATLGSNVEIGDLDFCQYVELAPAAMVTAAETFTAPSSSRVLIEADYGAIVAHSPWPNSWSRLKAEMLRAATIDEAQRFKVEFLGTVPGFGVLPISIVVLTSDFNDHSRGPASRSFVYQEAVAVPLSQEAPLWTLVDPSQIGKYIIHLRNQIDEFAAEKPLKAVKRALGLAYTVRLQEFVSEALDILLSPESSAYVRHARNVELARKLGYCTYEEREFLGESVQTLSTNSGENDEESMVSVANLVQRCHEFLGRLKSEFDRMDRQLAG